MTALQANAEEPNRDSGKKGKRPKCRLFKAMENGWWFNAPLPLLLPTLQKQGHRIVPTV